MMDAGMVRAWLDDASKDCAIENFLGERLLTGKVGVDDPAGGYVIFGAWSDIQPLANCLQFPSQHLH